MEQPFGKSGEEKEDEDNTVLGGDWAGGSSVRRAIRRNDFCQQRVMLGMLRRDAIWYGHVLLLVVIKPPLVGLWPNYSAPSKLHPPPFGQPGDCLSYQNYGARVYRINRLPFA